MCCTHRNRERRQVPIVILEKHVMGNCRLNLFEKCKLQISAENCRLHLSKSVKRGTAGSTLRESTAGNLSLYCRKGYIYYCRVAFELQAACSLAKLWRRITGCPFIKIIIENARLHFMKSIN